MLLWGSSRGRGHKKFITEQCESGEFLCSLWRKLLASFHSFISRYLLIDFQTLFHHGYGCRENVTLGVPLQLSFLEGISPSLSKPLFIFLISCPVVRNWLLWGVKPFVDTFSPCPCLRVATSCSTSLQSLSSSGSFLTIVSCLGNAAVTETAAECYWKSMVKAGLDRHEDHSSLSWFLPENRSPHDSNSRIQESFARGIRNPGLWNRKFSSRNPESH